MESLPTPVSAPAVDLAAATQPANFHRSSRRQILAAGAASLLASPALLLGDGDSVTQFSRRDEREIGKVFSPPGGQISRTFRSILSQEEAHVSFVTGLITDKPRKTATFQNLKQKSLSHFAKSARQIENTISGGYANAIASFNSQSLQSSAMTLAATESRHAGYLTGLTSGALNLTGTTVEDQLSVTEVLNVLQPYVKSLNGGATPNYSNIRSDANDIAILDFILFMEQFEFAYFQINVQKFFL